MSMPSKEELSQNLVIRLAGSDGRTWEFDAGDDVKVGEYAKSQGVELKPFIKTKDRDGNVHEVSPFDADGIREAVARGDTRHFDETPEPDIGDYFSLDALRAGAYGTWEAMKDPLTWVKGIGSASAAVLRGAVEGTVGTALAAAKGVTYLGESIYNGITGDDDHELSGKIGAAHDAMSKTLKGMLPNCFTVGEKYKKERFRDHSGATEAIEAADNIVEMVVSLKCIGLITKGVSAAQAASGAAKAAAAKAGHITTGALFGLGKYGEVASDENGPGGARQQAAALVAGTADAVIFGIWNPFKISSEAAAKMSPFMEATRKEVAKRVLLKLGQMAESGLSMATVEGVKQVAMMDAGTGTDSAWADITYKQAGSEVLSQFVVGSAFVAMEFAEEIPGRVAHWRARRAQGEAEPGLSDKMNVAMSYQVERARKTLCPDRHAQALYAYDRFAKMGGQAEDYKAGLSQAAEVRRVNEDGSVVFEDGSVWRLKGDGTAGATITITDGTILDAETGDLLGYRPRQESGAARKAAGTEEPGNSGNSGEAGNAGEAAKPATTAAAKAASNALVLLKQIDDGALPVKDLAIGDIEGAAEQNTGHYIEEWDAAKAKPIIVLEDLEGNLHALTGAKRLAMATAAGDETIKAVVVKEADGWKASDAAGLGAVENLREGTGGIRYVVEAVDTLGAEKVAEVAGWHRKHGDRDFAAHIQRGISVAKKASPELRAALADGTVDEDFAWHAASALSAERVGAGAMDAQRALLKLVGRVGGEELEAVMRGLERRGSKGDVADWDAAVAEERAKFNATKGAERGELDSDLVLVETADGDLKTLGEAEAEGKVKRPGNPEIPETPGSPENPENPGSPGGSGEAAKQPRTAEEIDRIEGTDLQGVSELVESIQAKGKPVQGGQRHYKLAKTSDLLKGIGLTGDYFTIKTGVIFKHYGKDADHTLSAADWANISESLANPLVVARYSWKDGDGFIHRPKNSYSIWTEAVINGKYAMVGIEVKSPGKEITVNSVTTVYGDEHISLREKDVIYSRGNGEGIRTLLNGPNPRQYSEPPTSAKSISNPPMEVNPADAPGFAAAQGAGTNRAVELRPAEDGSGAFSTVSHPHLRVTIDGDRKLYVVRGLTLDDFDGTDPAGIAALVAKIEGMAKASGCGIGLAGDGIVEAWDATRRQIRSEAEAAHAVQQNEAKRKAVVDRLTQSGLAEGGVVQDKETFDRMLAEKSGQPLEENGVVYGFCDAKTKTVYLNPEFFATPEGLETPIHEFGHLGVIACEKVNKAVYDRGMGLAGELLARGTGNGERGTEGIQKLVDFVNETYSDFTPEKRAEELLAQLIGKRGAKALENETDKTLADRVKAWLVEFWRGFGRALGLGDITPEEAEKMTLEQVADAIRAEMSSGRKFGERFAGVEFGADGARAVVKPTRVKRHLTPRQRKVEDFISKAGDADDPANPETDLLALWVDCGGRLFDKMPFKFATHHSAKSKTGIKRTRESIADEFGESGTFWDSLDNAERRIFFGTEKLEPGSIGEGFREALESAGITRFTAEDGTVDFDAAIAEFRRQWRNYERGERGLRERREAQLEEEREEFERQEDEELEAIFGKEDKSLTPEQIAAVDAEIEASRAAGYFSRGNRDGRLKFSRGEIEKRAEDAKAKGQVMDEALDKLSEIQKDFAAEKEKTGIGIGEYYKRVNTALGANHVFELGKPYGRLAQFIPDGDLQLKLRTLMLKMKEQYKSGHPFTFAETKNLVENVNNPPLIMRRDEATAGAKVFFEAPGGRIFCASINPEGNINDIETLYPKDFEKLVKTIARSKGKSKDILDVDTSKAVEMLTRRSNTALGEQPNDLEAAISVLNNFAKVNSRPRSQTMGERSFNGVTPAEDAAYAEAVKRGDMETVRHNQNNDIRFARGGNPPEAGFVKLTRVADDAGQGERTDAGIAASVELSRTAPVPLNTKGTRYVALPLSELHALARHLTGNAMPGEMESGKTLGAAGKASLKHRKLKIAADVLGVVDKTDLDGEKNFLKGKGLFRHEDPQWLAHHSNADAAAERKQSEEALSRRLDTLAAKRISGAAAGGETAARRVYADQLAKIVMAMPHGQPGVLGNLQTVAGALQKRVNGGEAEADAFLDWAEGKKPGSARTATDRKSGMFGAFLVMPQEVQTRAPQWYDAMRSVIAGDAKIRGAFRQATVRMMSEQGYSQLEKEILRMQDAQTEAAIRRLEDEARTPIKAGSAADVLKEKIVISCDDRMGAAAVRVGAKERAYLEAQKKLMDAAKTDAERAQIKQATDIFIGKLAQAKNQVELSRTAWERGRNNEDLRYFWRVVDLLNEATVRDGISVRDLSLYMDQQRVIETRGLSGSRGQSARQAQIVLDSMKRRLGADFAKVEAAARKFHAIHEQELLANPLLEKILGKGTADYWRSQTSYVTTKRQHSPEELAEIAAARAQLAASGAAGGDTVIGQMFKYIGRPETTAKLKGSFADKQEVISATMDKVAEVQRFLRRSEYVIQLRDLLTLANVEGVHDFPAGKNELKRGARYGTIGYMENGQRRTLVVPREIADGFEKMQTYDTPALKLCAKVNNWARQALIDFNPVYWHRNIARNAGSMEMNMPGMKESAVKRGLRFAFPGLAPVAEIAMTHIVRHMPERMTLGLRKIWGEHTALFYAPKAKRMAMWLTNHNDMQRRLWEAERRGDLGAVQEMEADRRDMLAALRANMLVGGPAGKMGATDGFLDQSLRTVGKTMMREAQDAAGRSKWQKAADAATWLFRKNAQQQTFEDIVAKFSAYLHDRAQFGKGNNRSAAESGVVVKKNVSIGEGERKGKDTGVVQGIFQPFWNMVEKGVVRNVKAYMERPAETFQKAAWRIVPMVLHGIVASGALAAWILKKHDGDEEAAKNGSLGDVYRYAKDAQRAWQNCSNYVRSNYHVTPLWTDGWTSVVIGMPLTDEERILAPVARFATDAAAVAAGAKTDIEVAKALRDMTLGAVAPDFKLAGFLPALLDDTVHALWENPQDYYTGGTKYDKDLWTARNESWGMRGRFLAAMGKRLWNDFGGRSFIPVDRAGVDNGLGRAPGWVAKMVNDIPVVSPILKSFVKVQVGSPKRDAAEITEAERMRNAICRVHARELFEMAREDGRDISFDAERYAATLAEWRDAENLTDDELAAIEAKYLNAWRDYEGAQYNAEGEREKFRSKAQKLGLDAAGVWLDFD